MGARDSTRPGHPLAAAAADDAGNRCRMVRVAVGRPGDELVGKVEAGERVDRSHFEGVAHIEISK